MKQTRRPADVQRVRYWQGQQLRSGDLRAQRTTDEELRWWHNRAAHGAYGVANGFSVTPTTSGYEVAPGLAYDGYGRELLAPCPLDVPRPCTVKVPPRPGFVTWTLLLAHDGGTSGSCAREMLDAACLPAGRCAANDRLRLFWVPRKLDAECAGVPLARYRFDGTTYIDDPDFVRPGVRPLALPRVVTGQTSPGYTGWDKWCEPVDPLVPDGDRALVGFQLSIDTSAAGFAKTPCYFAWLDGPRVWQSTPPTPPGNLPALQTNWHIPFDWIAAESPGGFVVRVPLVDRFVLQPRDQIVTLQNFLIFVGCYGIYVCWMAIEKACPPPYEWCQECCE
jgi:hypothetical protein